MTMNGTKPKQAEIVQIYHDPYTKLKPEGKAFLVKFLGSDGEGKERWRVSFLADGFKGERYLVRDAEGKL